MRYHSSGHISPHYDGEWVDDEDTRSLKTILIYLNPPGDYTGGVTRFLDHRDEEVGTRYVITPAGDTRGCDADVVATVPAEEGAALVFDAKMLHEGTEVVSGEKWLLRADIVYERVERAAESKQGCARNRATELINEAEWLEEEGRLQEAVAKYRTAYRICPELQFE